MGKQCGQRSKTVCASQSYRVHLGWGLPPPWSTGLGPTAILAMGKCATSPDVHPFKNAVCCRSGCGLDVQTLQPSCPSSKPIGTQTTKSATSIVVLLWIFTTSSCLSCGRKTSGSLQPLCSSSLLHSCIPCKPCSFYYHSQRCEISGQKESSTDGRSHIGRS